MGLFDFYCITESEKVIEPDGFVHHPHKKISFTEYLKCKWKGHECYVS